MSENRIGLLAGSYLKMDDKIHQAYLSGDVQAEYDFLAERFDLVAQIDKKPSELAELAKEEGSYLEAFQADLKVLNPEWKSDDSPERSDETMAALFDDDFPDTEKMNVIQDPVRSFVHARERLGELAGDPSKRMDYYLVRAYADQRAEALSKDIPGLTRFGSEAYEHKNAFLMHSGAVSGIDKELEEKSKAAAREYVVAFNVAANNSTKGAPHVFEEARADRIVKSQSLQHDLGAIIEVSKGLKNEQNLSGKIVSDIMQARGYKSVPQFDERMEQFEESLIAKNPSFKDDRAQFYAFCRDKVNSFEQGKPQGGIVLLRAMSEKLASEIKSDPTQLRNLTSNHPEFVQNFSNDALMRSTNGYTHQENEAKSSSPAEKAEERNEKVSDPKDGPSVGDKPSKARSSRDGSFRGEMYGSLFHNHKILRDRIKSGENIDMIALPLSKDASSLQYRGAILDNFDKDQISELYKSNVATMIALRKSPEFNTEAGKETHDHLELGRRLLSECLPRADRKANVDQMAQDSHPLVSKQGNLMDKEFRRDPWGHIQNGDKTARAAFLRNVRDTTKRSFENAYAKGNEMAKKGLDKSYQNAKSQAKDLLMEAV